MIWDGLEKFGTLVAIKKLALRTLAMVVCCFLESTAKGGTSDFDGSP